MPEASAISFPSTKETICPICDYEFYVEKLRGKRVNAGNINDELRREYQPMEKYGKVYPLIYPIIVCPECLYATYPADFKKVKPQEKLKLDDFSEKRKGYIDTIFGHQIDFEENRTLRHGVASYILAISTYSFMSNDVAPTFKRGLSSLRAAWLFETLSQEEPEDKEKYSYLRDTFYLKAEYYYNKAIEYEQKGKERLEDVEHLGPDTDNDYKYDGVKYISSVLSYKLSFLEPDYSKRIKRYSKIKSMMGRLFGFGKVTKEKPGPILEKAKDLYDSIQHKIKELEEISS
jgi:uncharacterized protein